LACSLAFVPGCADRTSQDTSYGNAENAFRRGELEQCQEQADREYQRFKRSNPGLAWKFRILEARAALWRGLYPEVFKLLNSSPEPPDELSLTVPRLTLLAVANIYTHQFTDADNQIQQATTLCKSSSIPSCGEVLHTQAFLASEQGHSATAEQLYNSSLSFARSHNDRFLECMSLLNLGFESLAQGHFDEAIDRSEAAAKLAALLDARVVATVAKGNIGWSYYKLGDLDRGLDLMLEAEASFEKLHSISNQENELTNIGYVYMDRGNFALAEQSFRKALALAEGIKGKADTYNAERVLARLSLQTGDLDQASFYSDAALKIARESKNHLDELYPQLVQGQVAARRGNSTAAQQRFEAIEKDKMCPVFLKWEAQHSQARLYEDGKNLDLADRQYRAALATFETTRADVQHEDRNLSFLTNGWRIYDDYIHFLVARGKTNDALRWADHSRARTLSEGLGLLKKGVAEGPPALNASAIARGNQSTVLYYWLGEKQSYVWAITPRQIKLFPLPPADQIDAAVQRYRRALAGPQDVLAYDDPDGRWLYSTLVATVQPLLDHNGSVFVVPDGSLNNLNFETLLVSEPKLHYWIDDATISNASSLLTLGSSYSLGKKQARSLLLLGNSIPANDKFPPLPRAALQIEAVSQHFPITGRLVLSREKATPAAYLDSHPEQFTNIHFVAHGTASRLSPLDSAIILSPTGADHEAFKLYAREIISRPLRADLVTISSCNGSGDRSYKGEGLVGLSWAFLRAGAHNVVAALWEVEDTSVEKLMTRFYDELDRGASPNAALRTAKLSLLHSDGLANPFYWAPFQLYTQGAAVSSGSKVASRKASPQTLRDSGAQAQFIPRALPQR